MKSHIRILPSLVSSAASAAPFSRRRLNGGHGLGGLHACATPLLISGRPLGPPGGLFGTPPLLLGALRRLALRRLGCPLALALRAALGFGSAHVVEQGTGPCVEGGGVRGGVGIALAGAVGTVSSELLGNRSDSIAGCGELLNQGGGGVALVGVIGSVGCKLLGKRRDNLVLAGVVSAISGELLGKRIDHIALEGPLCGELFGECGNTFMLVGPLGTLACKLLC